jgi:sugar lactone lactonase YvrE
VVSTFAGSGANGGADGIGTAASFNNPRGIAVDGSGTVYVTDRLNRKVRKITAAGVVSTLAGSGATVTFDGPVGIAVDSSGNVLVTDADNHTIRKLTKD